MPPSRAAAIHGPLGDVDAVEHYAAGVGIDHAAGHAEAGRLAGAVGAEQPDDLARIDLEIDAIDDATASVSFHQAANFEQRHRASSMTGEVISDQFSVISAIKSNH